MKALIDRVCLCGNEFKVSEARFKAGRGKYCSKVCFYKYKVRPKGLVYKITKVNKGWFKEGHIPWSKGTHYTPTYRPSKGVHLSPQTEFKEGQTKGIRNAKWKGDSVGYYALHTWLRREIGKPVECLACGSSHRVQWANKSRRYERRLDDWVSLCQRCHSFYDVGTFGAIERKYGK